MCVIILCLVAFLVLVMFCACVMSGKADEAAEQDFEEFKKKIVIAEDLKKRKGEEEDVTKK